MESQNLNESLPWTTDDSAFVLYLSLLMDDGYYEGYKTFENFDDSNVFHELNGWHFIIHNTDDFLLEHGFHLTYMLSRTNYISIEPKLFLIDDELKKWKPEKRGCYLPDEKDLRFFKKYTKRNCEHECLSFATLRTCKCVPFHMIRTSNFYRNFSH